MLFFTSFCRNSHEIENKIQRKTLQGNFDRILMPLVIDSIACFSLSRFAFHAKIFSILNGSTQTLQLKNVRGIEINLISEFFSGWEN
jgi:hypothetical protein